MARISYVEQDNAPNEVADIFTKMETRGARVGNVWKMAAHSPSTLLHLIRLGNYILTKTKLNPKLREMAILREAVILDCEYVRSAHVVFGKEVGITNQQLMAINDWENSGTFSEEEQAVLRFTDEVVKFAKVTDETFSDLGRYLEQGMMVELALTIGYYGMLARIILPFEVDLSDEPPASSSQITGNSQR